jgi:polyadenylate-binding protein 2
MSADETTEVAAVQASEEEAPSSTDAGDATPAPTTATDDPTADAEASAPEDPEMAVLKQKIEEMEQEKNKLVEMEADYLQSETAGAAGDAAAPTESKEEVDLRSVYVGRVDFAAQPEELQQHFSACGPINRITILCDKFTGRSKGYAYIEFASIDCVSNALALNESVFKGRALKVTEKRTNAPGMGHRGRGGFRGGFRGGMGGMGGYGMMPMPMPGPFRGGGYRARGYRNRRGFYAPY